MATTITPSRRSNSEYSWVPRATTHVPRSAVLDAKSTVDRSQRSEGGRAFFESSRDALFVASIDEDGIWRLEEFNRAFAEVLGMKLGAVCCEPRHALPVDFATRLSKALRRYSSNHHSNRFDMTVRSDGGFHCWEFLLEPTHESGAIQRRILGHGTDVTSQRQTTRDLKRITRKLLKVQDEERRRIARDLHDSTAQHLVALGLGIKHLEILANQEGILSGTATRRLIADMRATLSQALSEIRTLSLLLHPPELNGTHVADALRRFVTGFARRTSIRASLIVDEDLSCRSTDAAIALMRITQEALINVYRHANATEVKVDLSADDGTLVLKIMDNGKGVGSRVTAAASDDVEMVGVGIPGMRAHLHQFKGALFVKDDGCGVQITALIPQGPARADRRGVHRLAATAIAE